VKIDLLFVVSWSIGKLILYMLYKPSEIFAAVGLVDCEIAISSFVVVGSGGRV
jgi:hypothetical protein